jgi:hypothetical protein
MRAGLPGGAAHTEIMIYSISSRLIASLVRSFSLVVRGDSPAVLFRGWFAIDQGSSSVNFP